MYRNCSGRVTDEGYFLAAYWSATGATPGRIAELLNVSRSTVQRTLTHADPPSQREADNPRPEGEQARVVARRRLVRQLASTIERVVSTYRGVRGRSRPYCIRRRQFSTSTALVRELANRGIAVSGSTVRRDLAALGFHARVKPWGPTRKEGDEARRLAFCRRHARTNPDALIFSDEKYGNCNEHVCRTEWRRDSEPPCHRIRDRFTPKIHVWGAIGVGVKRLVPLPAGTLDAEGYRRHCLQPFLEHLTTRTFIQDGAKVHKARGTIQWLQNHRVQTVDWPARSPDLNPIEVMWARCQRQVANRQPPPWTAAEVQVAWVEEWNAIPQAEVDQLVRSFRPRVLQCIAQAGRTIRLTEKLKRHWDRERVARRA